MENVGWMDRDACGAANEWTNGVAGHMTKTQTKRLLKTLIGRDFVPARNRLGYVRRYNYGQRCPTLEAYNRCKLVTDRMAAIDPEAYHDPDVQYF